MIGRNLLELKDFRPRDHLAPRHTACKRPTTSVGIDLGQNHRAAQCRQRLAKLGDHVEPVEYLAFVSVTVHGKQDGGLDLPESVEHAGQTAPMLVTARNAMTVSGMFGITAATRSPGRSPRSRRPAASAAVLAESSSQLTSRSDSSSERNRMAGLARVACLNRCWV